jgi:oligo-1,6-glucosidase
MPQFSLRSRLRDVAQHPLGRDVIDKLVLHTGLPKWLPSVIGNLRLGTIDKLLARLTGGRFMDVLVGMVNQIPDRPTMEGPPEHPWWRSAVFYQVYPRSFVDSDGDGIGDIRGVISRLDYLQDLGVDCVWLSPIFDSPNNDMGYDIRDYRGIMAEMGTLDDVDELIAGCHERGMRIILDLVVNHTSIEHEWFRAAVADPDGPYGDYYFLVDGTPDEPPTNWQSFFSGSAWNWIPEAGRWGLHLFDHSQMDLDWTNPAVRREVAEMVQWWLARGIDGFRMDVINYISKPDGLPQGHPFVGDLLEFTGIEHYLYGPRLDEYLAELRRDGFTRADGTTAVMIGETPGIGIQAGRLLSGWARKELDLIFNFDGLDTPGKTRWHDYVYDLNYLARFWADYNAQIGEGDWVSLFVENHDNPRMVSKVHPDALKDPETRIKVAKLIATMQLTMRGTPFIFQGQELGAVNEPFTAPEDLRDVESINRHAALLASGLTSEDVWGRVLAGSRDHSRTPIRWTEDQDDSIAWLPGHERTPGFSVAAQLKDPTSVHAWYRELIALRRQHTALRTGRLEVVHHARDVFVYVRRDEESSWLVELNLGRKRRKRPASTADLTPVLGHRGPTMAPWEVTVSRMRPRGRESRR